MTTDDMELVRQYAASQSESAFAALVSRHANLVYSAALRRTASPQLAEEITQAVFIILARKAGSLNENTIVSGWLYRTACYVSGHAFRQELRRKQREQEAYMQSLSNQTESEVWPRIRPLLEEAMLRLGQTDRDALVLHYFEGRNLKEVGAIIGSSEAATKMRVNRAVEKLQKFFLKRGVTSTTATLAGAISTNSVQAAPAALAQTATTAAMAKGAAASGSTLTLINGALKIMAWSKAKTVIVGGAVLVLAAATTTLVAVKITKSQNVRPNQTSLESDSKAESQVIADRTTPRGALLVMANAMQAGDAKAYVDSCVFTGADELKLKGLLEEFVIASAKFRAVIAEKYGKEQAEATQNQMPLALPTELFKAADVKIVGDSATVDPFKNVAKGGKTRPIQMIKTGNEWKLNGFGLLPVKAAVLNNVIPGIIAALNQTAGEIPQGKYLTAAEAVKTMKDRADY